MPRIGNHKNTTNQNRHFQPKLIGTKRKHPQFARRKQKKTEEKMIDKNEVNEDVISEQLSQSEDDSVDVEKKTEATKPVKKSKKIVSQQEQFDIIEEMSKKYDQRVEVNNEKDTEKIKKVEKKVARKLMNKQKKQQIKDKIYEELKQQLHAKTK